MPPYATAVQVAVLGPPINDPFLLFNAEVLTAPANSIPVQWNPAMTGGSNNSKTFQAIFASAPAAAVVNILGSNTNVLADFVILGTLTFTGTQVSMIYPDVTNCRYYMGELLSGAAGIALTLLLNA